MTEVIPFKRTQEKRRELREEASAWLARVDAGMTPEEKERLEVWLASDREHVQVFMELAVLWDQMTVLTELADIFPLENYMGGTPTRKRRITRLPLLAAAAAILISMVLILPRYDQSEPLPAHYATVVGEQKLIELPDGSMALLNTDSQLAVDFTDSVRDLELIQGEALFTVTPDEDRPFRVRAGNRVVEAVGTAFSVQRDRGAGNIEVIVSEGEVRVRQDRPEPVGPVGTEVQLPPQESVLLTAGHFISMQEGADDFVTELIQPEDIEVRLSWQHGMLLFQNEPLEEVLREVARYTTTTIEADESIRELRVEGYFRVGDIDGLLMAMENNFQVEIQRLNDNHIIVSGQTQ